MLNKTPDQPLKTINVCKKNYFPSLSNKKSETPQKERYLDLGFTPHWNDTLLVTDSSSGNRFFHQPEAPKTCRAVSYSLRVPMLTKPKETFLLKQTENSLNFNPSKIWEITERVDTFKIRSDSKQTMPKTETSINDQLKIWKNCSNEIGQLFKSINLELFNSFSIMNSKIFSLIDDIKEINKEIELVSKEKIKMLNNQVKSLQNEAFFLQKQNLELFESYKLSDLKIKKEIDEMFPSNEEEIKRFKEESALLRDKKASGLPGALQQLYYDMCLEQALPEETEIDLSGMNVDDLMRDLKDKYKLIITRTVRSVKKNVSKKYDFSCQKIQTEAIYIEPSMHEDLIKQLDKTLILYQSTLLQLDNHKEDNNKKNQIIEKIEFEKNQLRSENLQWKRDFELSHKEIHNLKLDIEGKKRELTMIQKQSKQKTEIIIQLESQIDLLKDKNLDLSNELEKFNRSKPASRLMDKRPSYTEITELVKEQKKNRLDEVTKSGLTVRQELEKEYSNKLLEVKHKIKENGEGINKLKEINSRNSSDGYIIETSHFDNKRQINEKESEDNKESEDKRENKDKKEPKNNKQNEDNKEIDDKYIKNEKYQNIENQKKDEKYYSDEKNKEEDKREKNYEGNKEINKRENNEKKEKKETIEINANTFNKSLNENHRSYLNVPKEECISDKITLKIPEISNIDENDIKETEKSNDLQSLSKVNTEEGIIDKEYLTVKKSDSKYSIKESSIKKLSKKEEIIKNKSFKQIENSNKSKASLAHSDDKTINPRKMSINNTSSSNISLLSKHSADIPDKKLPSPSKKAIEKQQINQSMNDKPIINDKSASDFQEATTYEDIAENQENFVSVYPKTNKPLPSNIIHDIQVKETLENNARFDSTILSLGNNKTKENICDKMCGRDFTTEIDIGIQTNLYQIEEETHKETNKTYYFPYNPNNVYGLRGDIYYQKNSFIPQARIPDMNSSIMFQPAYKYG